MTDLTQVLRKSSVRATQSDGHTSRLPALSIAHGPAHATLLRDVRPRPGAIRTSVRLRWNPTEKNPARRKFMCEPATCTFIGRLLAGVRLAAPDQEGHHLPTTATNRPSRLGDRCPHRPGQIRSAGTQLSHRNTGVDCPPHHPRVRIDAAHSNPAHV